MKICKDCKYYVSGSHTLQTKCKHPKFRKVNSVTGNHTHPACEMIRHGLNECGSQGLLFEEKPAKRTFADKISNYFHCGRYE